MSGAAVPVDGAAELVVAPEPAGSLPQATKKVGRQEGEERVTCRREAYAGTRLHGCGPGISRIVEERVRCGRPG